MPCVWDPPIATVKNISAVEMVKRRATSFVGLVEECRRTSSVSAPIKTLGWHSLAHRRKVE